MPYSSIQTNANFLFTWLPSKFGKGVVAADELCVLSTILSSMSGLGSNYFLLLSEKQRRRSVEEKVITHLNVQSTERSTIEFEIWRLI